MIGADPCQVVNRVIWRDLTPGRVRVLPRPALRHPHPPYYRGRETYGRLDRWHPRARARHARHAGTATIAPRPIPVVVPELVCGGGAGVPFRVFRGLQRAALGGMLLAGGVLVAPLGYVLAGGPVPTGTGASLPPVASPAPGTPLGTPPGTPPGATPGSYPPGTVAVPEPSALVAFAAGLAGLALVRGRRA